MDQSEQMTENELISQAKTTDLATEEGSEGLPSVRALTRGLRIMACFDAARPDWTITELSRQLSLNKATVYRLVKTLEREGFLTCNPTTLKYHVGSTILRVAYSSTSNAELVRIALPLMQRLSADTAESVDLCIRVQDGVLIVGQVLSPRSFHPAYGVGRVLPDLGNSHIKVFLAYSSEEERHQVLSRPIPQLSPYSITDPVEIARQLTNAAIEGVAFDFQDAWEGICSVGAPVRDFSGEVRATLAVVMPAERFGEPEVAKFPPIIKRIAAELSNKLGYRQP